METLFFLKDTFPKRRGAVVKELTKIYEKVYRGTIKELYDEIEKSEIKGECPATQNLDKNYLIV